MIDRPIIFSAPMVRALLEGRKTMTRRLAWKRNQALVPADNAWAWRKDGWLVSAADDTDTCLAWRNEPSPWQRVQPGDRLWVRESVQAEDHDEEDIVGVRYLADDLWCPLPDADEWRERQYVLRCYRSADPDLDAYKAVPAIHMPRWVSRLTLTVTAVRAERLQDISEADAVAEGVPFTELPQGRTTPDPLHRGQFADLWNSLHGPAAWEANPEVVVLTFTVRKGNIDDGREWNEVPA